MRTYVQRGLVCLALSMPFEILGCGAAVESESPQGPALGRAQALHDSTAVFAYVDMMTYELKFYEPSLDMEASVDLRTLPGYGDGVPLHAYITDGGRKVYVAFNGDDTKPTGLAVVRVDDIFWHDHDADLELLGMLIVDDPAPTNSFPPVTEVTPRQPFQAWTAQPFSQLHGPAELPGSDRLFWTILTDNRVVTVDTAQDTLLPTRRFGDASRFLHGVTFNAGGTRALGAGYFYDRGYLPLFGVKPNEELGFIGKIWLGSPSSHAAFVHNVEWLTKRYAIVGTMQFDRTSLTPPDTEIIGPSLWLVDAKTLTARQILGAAADVDAAGVFRSASWVEVIGTTLFIGEEDSLDASFGDDGFVSVFDISHRLRPRFIRRLVPGGELPTDFSVAHAMVVTPDETSLILESYVSGYVLRIDANTLAVEHVIQHHPGHAMPHGGSIVSTLVGPEESSARAASIAPSSRVPRVDQFADDLDESIADEFVEAPADRLE